MKKIQFLLALFLVMFGLLFVVKNDALGACGTGPSCDAGYFCDKYKCVLINPEKCIKDSDCAGNEKCTWNGRCIPREENPPPPPQPTATPVPTKKPTPTPTLGGPTVTPNPLCVCGTTGACSNKCSFNKLTGVTYPTSIKCNLSTALFPTPPTAANETDWCKRPNKTKGDANGDDKLTNLDYFYYVSAVNGAKIPAGINPDFNGDGEVGTSDRAIIVKSL